MQGMLALALHAQWCSSRLSHTYCSTTHHMPEMYEQQQVVHSSCQLALQPSGAAADCVTAAAHLGLQTSLLPLVQE